MIEATVAIVAMAGLFVLFGTLRLADRAGCDGGCPGCAGGSCEHHGDSEPRHDVASHHDFHPHADGGVP